MATALSPTQIQCKKNPHVDNVYKDILDEEFQNYLDLTYALMKNFVRPRDVHICCKYIKRCTALDANKLEVKLNRNEFFKYFFNMLRTASCIQPTILYEKWYPKKESDITQDSDRVTKHWSADKKTYVAAKAIAGFGTLVYIAVSYEPDLGWQPSGFSSYDF